MPLLTVFPHFATTYFTHHSRSSPQNQPTLPRIPIGKYRGLVISAQEANTLKATARPPDAMIWRTLISLPHRADF
jgi:hypothetical protein